MRGLRFTNEEVPTVRLGSAEAGDQRRPRHFSKEQATKRRAHALPGVQDRRDRGEPRMQHMHGAQAQRCVPLWARDVLAVRGHPQDLPHVQEDHNEEDSDLLDAVVFDNPPHSFRYGRASKSQPIDARSYLIL